MLGWMVRLLLALSGSIASWFIAHDSLSFDVVQMVIAILLITLIVFTIAFWGPLIKFIKRMIKRYK